MKVGTILPEHKNACLPFYFNRFISVSILLALTLCAIASPAQVAGDSPYYARKNTLGIFGAYSGDSSHILMGEAENRRLVELGVSYSRRLATNRIVNWQYDAEVLPVVLESDPMSIYVYNQTKPVQETITLDNGPAVSCTPVTSSYSYTDPVTGITHSETITIFCRGRRWVVGQAMSPGGFRWNFLPQRKMQPFLSSHAGYMYSSQEVPISGAGSFNFTFDIGAGFELYRSKSRSIRAEYRYHHISNGNTAHFNPGIDNGLFQIMYCFGR